MDYGDAEDVGNWLLFVVAFCHVRVFIRADNDLVFSCETI